MYDKDLKVEIDITVNKVLEIFNSQLLCTYAQIDLRFI